MTKMVVGRLKCFPRSEQGYAFLEFEDGQDDAMIPVRLLAPSGLLVTAEVTRTEKGQLRVRRVLSVSYGQSD